MTPAQAYLDKGKGGEEICRFELRVCAEKPSTFLNTNDPQSVFRTNGPYQCISRFDHFCTSWPTLNLWIRISVMLFPVVYNSVSDYKVSSSSSIVM